MAANSRYEPPQGFNHTEVNGLLPHKQLASKKAQIWLIQLPTEVDVDALEGASVQMPEDSKSGDSMVLKTSDGLSLRLLEEESMMANQMYIAAPSGSASLPPSRRVTRRLTCISTKTEDTMVAEDPSTPAKSKKSSKDKNKDSESHKSARKSEKKKKKNKEDDESDEEPRSHKKKKKSRKD
mmetsp:Transcript_38722/g.84241  ORF Transcript_38722/g.84241 Transcript_38722/m.84241 type:complete len:181 (-) Transcript_38722:117-659(-)|eukprot:CAMPEP_0118927312 /NCGR_PEP_ID=MMETSP1169-20130426/4811_1 /TAXON_ID=36882 /ORGANISM="Pyramimonas obovata, Strain CCMP722" /LENGTH=180 /DNA_ID=CAMNT_0006869055 /DNA_START=95 /DNA_END=637 /DNA_ORIENTATION=-